MKLRTVAFASTAAVIAAVAIGSGAAQATSLITGKDVKDGSIHRADLGAGINHRLDRLATSGAQGLPGKDGKDGAQGPAGTDGAQGPAGKDGAQGPAGKDGAQGPAGKDDAQGPAGKDGAQGPAGKDGAQGPAGKDGVSGMYYRTALYGSGYDPSDANPKIDVRVNAGAIATVKCTNESDVAIAGGVQVLGLGLKAPNTPVSSSFPGRFDWANNKPFENRLDGWIVQFGGNPDQNDPLRAKVWVLCAPAGSVLPTVDTIAS